MTLYSKRYFLLLLVPFFSVFGSSTSPVNQTTWSGQPWTNGNVTVSMQCQEDDMSGCSSTLCSGGTPKSITLSQNSGPLSLCHLDNAGNEVRNDRVYVNWIDKIVPTITGQNCKSGGVDYLGGWTNTDIICSFVANDGGGSNIKSLLTFGLGNVSLQSWLNNSSNLDKNFYRGGFVLSDNQLSFYSNPRLTVVDYANNSRSASISDLGVVKIDKVAPIIGSMSCKDSNNQSYGGSWTNKNVTCSSILSDPNISYNSGLKSYSGFLKAESPDKGGAENIIFEVAHTATTLESTDSLVATKMFSNNQDNKYDYMITDSRDYANNSSTKFQNNIDIKIDKTRPVIGTVACRLPDNTNYVWGRWTNESILCESTVTDPDTLFNSALKSIVASFNAGGSEDKNFNIISSNTVVEVTDSYVLSHDLNTDQKSIYKYNATATDYGDNTATIPEFLLDVRIDKVKPVISSLSCKDSDNQTYSGLWTNKNISCSAQITDTNTSYNSGLNVINGSIESTNDRQGFKENKLGLGFNSQPLETTDLFDVVESFSLEQDQSYKYEITRAIDHAGNEHSFLVSGIDIKIDKTSPVINAVQLKNGGDYKNLNSSFTNYKAEDGFHFKLNVVDLGDSISGVDWGQSLIEIDGPSTLDLGLTEIGSLPAGILFDESTKVLTITAESDLFEKKGDYTVMFKFFDIAGNSITSDLLKVRIIPAEVSVVNSSLAQINTSFCVGDNSFLADGVDVCDYEVELFDKYQNLIVDRDGYLLSIKDHNSLTAYELISDATKNQVLLNLEAQHSFRDGLKFNSSSNLGDSFAFNLVGGAQNFKISSLMPSVEVLKSVSRNIVLTKPVERSVVFVLRSKKVNHDGSLNLLEHDQFDFFSGSLNSTAWVKNSLSDTNSSTPSDPIQLSMGVTQKIWTHLSTELSNHLPLNVTITVKAYVPTDTTLVNNDLVNIGAQRELVLHNNSPVNKGSIDTEIYVEGSSEEFSDIKLMFSSDVSYELLENGVAKSVRYPGWVLGNQIGADTLFVPSVGGDLSEFPIDDIEVEALIVGADIEGKVINTSGKIAYQNSSSNESNFNKLGQINVKDVREDITKRVFSLTRGIPKELIIDNKTLTGLDFDSGDNVIYLSGKFSDGLDVVKLSGNVKGVGTLIIEDANLQLVDDLNYVDSESSLGVILINNETKSYPEVGNIFIDSVVQHFVGLYFADGGVMSVKSGVVNPLFNGSSSSYDLELDSTFGKQLLLDGSLLTRNTLGGSLKLTKLVNWGEVQDFDISLFGGLEELKISQKYDLHLMRRYTPPRYTQADEDSGNGIANMFKPDSENLSCYKPDSLSCDDNAHAFVIRPDYKNELLTPPGFK